MPEIRARRHFRTFSTQRLPVKLTNFDKSEVTKIVITSLLNKAKKYCFIYFTVLNLLCIFQTIQSSREHHDSESPI